jgi:hypothetical protein
VKAFVATPSLARINGLRTGVSSVGKSSMAGPGPLLQPARRSRHAPAVLGANMNFVLEGAQRILSCFPYILPMMDALGYGRFLFQKVPLMATIFMKPLQPFVELSQTFPMLSFVSFLGLFLFVVRNKNMPRFVRFNTMQALLLEIILIFPQILTSSNMGGLIPFMFTEFISNMTFYAIVSIVGYSCICNIRGELPCKIPVISTAVFQQVCTCSVNCLCVCAGSPLVLAHLYRHRPETFTLTLVSIELPICANRLPHFPSSHPMSGSTQIGGGAGDDN